MSCIKLFVSLFVLAVAAPALNPAKATIVVDSSEAFLGAPVKTVITTPEALQAGDRVFVVFGTGRGQSTLTVGGVDVAVPFGESAWSGGQVEAVAPGASRTVFAAMLPLDPTLVGRELGAAVVVVKANGTFFVSARTGGPIIQDALS